MSKIPGVTGRDAAELLRPQAARRQALRGFDADYADIVDYIVRCTHRIWEQKRVDLIRTHYAPDCRVRTLAGETVGVEAVIDGTVATLDAWPDRTLYADDVIWSGDESEGFYTSHRITSLMTQAGYTEFGPARGQQIRTTTIADCVVRENRIVEEWLARDTGWMARQLGVSPIEAAKRLGRVRSDWLDAEIARVRGSSPDLSPFARSALPREPEAIASALLHGLMAAQDFGLAHDLYWPNTTIRAPGGRALLGPGEAIGWYVRVAASFGAPVLSIDHISALREDPIDGDARVTVRWMLVGTHKGGPGHIPPTGREIGLMGIDHLRVREGRVREHWSVFDEVALLRQLLPDA